MHQGSLRPSGLLYFINPHLKVINGLQVGVAQIVFFGAFFEKEAQVFAAGFENVGSCQDDGEFLLFGVGCLFIHRRCVFLDFEFVARRHELNFGEI